MPDAGWKVPRGQPPPLPTSPSPTCPAPDPPGPIGQSAQELFHLSFQPAQQKLITSSCSGQALGRWPANLLRCQIRAGGPEAWSSLNHECKIRGSRCWPPLGEAAELRAGVTGCTLGKWSRARTPFPITSPYSFALNKYILSQRLGEGRASGGQLGEGYMPQRGPCLLHLIPASRL